MRVRFAISRRSSSSAATAAHRSICAFRSPRSAGRSTGWSRSSARRCWCATVLARRRPTPGRLLFERSQPILRQLEDAAAEIKSASAGYDRNDRHRDPAGRRPFPAAAAGRALPQVLSQHVAEDHLGIQRHDPRGAGARPRRRRVPARAAAAERFQASFRCWRRKSSWSASAAPCRRGARTFRPPSCSACR